MAVDPERAARGRRSKSRGKEDERALARILGCRRWPADTGMCEDLDHPTLSVQVKGGRACSTPANLALGLAQARAGAQETGKLPALALVVHNGRGRKKGAYLVFDACEFAAWSGWGQEGDGHRLS